MDLVGYYAQLCADTDFHPAANALFQRVWEAYYNGGFIQSAHIAVGDWLRIPLPSTLFPTDKVSVE
ncbi:MAG: hypothetical protein NUV98_02840 [Candidatus Roizmanbacteria bacterium]|nr:hypothetical protein [Candidatus Roizmanbacteria bacterium]